MRIRNHSSTILLLYLTLLSCIFHESHAKLITLSSEQEHENLVREGKPFLIQFTATWCPACQKIKQTVEEVAGETEFDLTPIVRVDIDKLPALATRYSIKSIPAFVSVNKNGAINITREITHATGQTKDNLRSALRTITNQTPTDTLAARKQDITPKIPTQDSSKNHTEQTTVLAFLKHIIVTIKAYLYYILQAIKNMLNK